MPINHILVSKYFSVMGATKILANIRASYCAVLWVSQGIISHQRQSVVLRFWWLLRDCRYCQNWCRINQLISHFHLQSAQCYSFGYPHGQDYSYGALQQQLARIASSQVTQILAISNLFSYALEIPCLKILQMPRNGYKLNFSCINP